MPAPYDYSSVLSPVDPGQAIMQGVLQGEKLLRNQQQYQQQQQEYQRAQQQRVVAEERKAQFDSELEALAESRDPRDITGLLIKYPEQEKILKGISERLSSEQIDVMLGDYTTVMGLYESGRLDLVEGFYEEKIELFENSGRQEEAANTKNVLEMFKSDPEGWALTVDLPRAAYDQSTFLEEKAKRRQAQIDFQTSQIELKNLEKEVEGSLVNFDVQSSDILPDGSIVMVGTDGTSVVRDPSGQLVVGAARAGVIETGQEYGVDIQTRRARGREGAKISQQISRESFETLGKVRKNIGNLDAAIAALDEGADTGVIESRFPDWKASSIELRNIQRQLGLDVIGSVTFGALSESELELALATALPLQLQEEDLKDWLTRKKEAQLKLSAELQNAVMFFSGGGTVGEYVKFQESYKVPSGAQTPMGQSSESVQISVEY
jgi:hypothetical protein